MKLHTECIQNDLHRLLLSLMQLPELAQFRLVGGTALALYIGHRQSIDIDLFCDEAFSTDPVVNSLDEKYNIHDMSVATNSISGFIDNIKIDLISHRYRWIDSFVDVEGIRLASLRDIAAMKLNAVCNRGSKKDFWDIAALLKVFTWDELLSQFSERYPNVNTWQVVRAAGYFDDAEGDPELVVCDNSSWQEVKEYILVSLRKSLPKE